MLKKIIGLCIVAVLSLSANSFDRNLYLTGQIKVKGESAPGQNRYSALRSAQLAAQRNLLEVIGGLQLTSSSKLRDGLLLDDFITTQLQGYLKGAVVLEENYNPQDGSASVVMGIGYLGSMSNVLAKAQETGVLQRTLYKAEKPIYFELEKEVVAEVAFDKKETIVKKTITTKEVTTTIPNTPVAHAEVMHDSLIIDVRGLDFEPAQINRIYFDNKLIYDPLMVPSEIIAQRGLAKYTTTLNRAKAILESYNSTNPLIVKATKTTKLSSDVIVSKDDAIRITKENISKGFLESAKIVFILE